MSESSSTSASEESDEELNYSSYLRIDELLELQTPQSEPAQHDELLFIVVHQVSELWFKELLSELEKVKVDFSAGNAPGAVRTFTRVRRILRVLAAQLEVLETMTPMSFSAFRGLLDTASGFQSMQFRMIEFALGAKRADVLEYYPDDMAGLDAAKAALVEPSVGNHFYEFLVSAGVEVPTELLEVDPSLSIEPNEQIQDAVLELYRSEGDLVSLFELMLDVDAGLQEWRYRHVQLVRRTIGDKTGTNGSLGAEFLMRTLFRPVFPDLWAIRHRL